ncbi:MAG: ATP-binding protein [Thermoplasmata archaeon]
MVQIESIINQNPWWKYDSFGDFDKHLSELNKWPIHFKRRELPLETGNIYLLRGPRQVGKTTLIKEQISNLVHENVDPESILYYPCDYVRSRRELRNVIEYHLNRNRASENLFIFLDEITYLQDWSREVKAQVDVGLLKRATLVLTGSGAAHLKREAEQLPGRGLEGNQYLLLPLTFREFLLQASPQISSHLQIQLRRSLDRARERLKENTLSLDENIREQRENIERIVPHGPDLDYLFRTYLLTGGFPQAINRHFNNQLKSIDEEAYATLTKAVLGDFSKRGREEALARQILEGIVSRHGTRFGYRTLSGDVDATHPTVIKYLTSMDDSLLTQTVYAVDFQRRTARYKADKKVYFADPFFYHSVNALIKGQEGFSLSREVLDDSTSLSSLVEGVVASHLTQTRVKPYMAEPMTILYFFYNPRSEVDFVYRQEKGEFTGIEVKYGVRERKGTFPNVSQLRERIVLTRDSIDFSREETQIPLAIFLSLLRKSECCL